MALSNNFEIVEPSKQSHEQRVNLGYFQRGFLEFAYRFSSSPPRANKFGSLLYQCYSEWVGHSKKTVQIWFQNRRTHSSSNSRIPPMALKYQAIYDKIDQVELSTLEEFEPACFGNFVVQIFLVTFSQLLGEKPSKLIKYLHNDPQCITEIQQRIIDLVESSFVFGTSS
eukprot:TRINITY_DN1816_c0_g1_i1.p1 TRINITY_DN1816_c0_g1~~TRINITY_DN1816_c0_g1_i1.p1  ORF type:complete len:169 (+),score=45.50 TRINITY_DN1816_c0_g1_i1:39-545(+)